MQFPTQGQWWSNFSTQNWHTEQCEVLEGLQTWQVVQYFSLLRAFPTGRLKVRCSRSYASVMRGAPIGPLACPYTCWGIYPGSVVETWYRKNRLSRVSSISIIRGIGIPYSVIKYPAGITMKTNAGARTRNPVTKALMLSGLNNCYPIITLPPK